MPQACAHTCNINRVLELIAYVIQSSKDKVGNVVASDQGVLEVKHVLLGEERGETNPKTHSTAKTLNRLHGAKGTQEDDADTTQPRGSHCKGKGTCEE